MFVGAGEVYIYMREDIHGGQRCFIYMEVSNR